MRVNNSTNNNQISSHSISSKSTIHVHNKKGRVQSKTDLNQLKGTNKTIELCQRKSFSSHDLKAAPPVAGKTISVHVPDSTLSEIKSTEHAESPPFKKEALTQVKQVIPTLRSSNQIASPQPSNDKVIDLSYTLPPKKQQAFLQWLENPSNKMLIDETLKAIENKTILPWEKIIGKEEVIGFLNILPLSESDRLVLQNLEAPDLMRMLPTNKQKDLLADQLKQNLPFTSVFITELLKWDLNPDERFEMPPSGNTEFDQKLQTLAIFLYQENICSEVGAIILLSFLYQPELDLKALFPLLAKIKNNHNMNMAHLFDFIDLVHTEPRLITQLDDPRFLYLLKKGNVDLFVETLKSLQQKELLDIFCVIHPNRAYRFLDWLKIAKNEFLISEARQAIQDSRALPWKEILEDLELMAFLRAAPFLSDIERWILSNQDVQNLMRTLPHKQINLLTDQLKQDFKLTSSFLTQLIQWKNHPSARFEMPPSGNAEFDQKLQALANFLDQENIPKLMGIPLLLSFLFQPDINLEDVYPLLKSLKGRSIHGDHLFYLIQAEPQIKAQLTRPRILALLKQGKINANMLVGALQKVDEKLKSLSSGEGHYEKKKRGEHYGFTLDEKGHYFIRTYPLGRGTFKKAAKAVSDIGEDTIVLSFTTKKIDSFTNTKVYNRSEPQKELEKEEKILNLKLKNVMPPFISTQEASNRPQPLQNNKFFAVQVEMSGDGDRLIQGPPKQILYALTDVVQSLIELHQAGYYHSDFKPGNFLFKGNPSDPSKPIQGYLHDFGLVGVMGQHQTKGTPIYAPPETMRPSSGQTDSGKVDAYAIGVSLIAMLLNVYLLDPTRAFYKATSQQELDDFINIQFAQLDKSRFSEEENKIIEDLLTLAKQLVSHDVATRLSCPEALAQLTALKDKYPFPS